MRWRCAASIFFQRSASLQPAHLGFAAFDDPFPRFRSDGQANRTSMEESRAQPASAALPPQKFDSSRYGGCIGRDTLAACWTSALAVVQLAGSTWDHCAAACTSSVEGRGPRTPPLGGPNLNNEAVAGEMSQCLYCKRVGQVFQRIGRL
jgi:hypothetical protein